MLLFFYMEVRVCVCVCVFVEVQARVEWELGQRWCVTSGHGGLGVQARVEWEARPGWRKSYEIKSNSKL